MSRHKRSEVALSRQPVPGFLATKVRSPLLVVLGSPAELVNLLAGLPDASATCYQMDHYQAGRLRTELEEAGLSADVVTAPDLWDLPAQFQSAIYMPARSGERQLKIDMVDQAYQVLRPGGAFFVWSSYVNDPLFTSLLKKIFGRARQPPHQPGEEVENVLWCTREEDHPRRRHEITFQVKISDGPSCRFVSRPGTFSYGRFDNGARALCEVMEIEPGDRVLDLGCGIGTNGVFASQQSGPSGHIAFVDSNARAIALAEMNARANRVTNFETFATATVEGPQEDSFDVVLANPPYYADSSIARLFIERAKKLLTPQGRFFLVTRQPEELGEAILDNFEEAEAVVHRGYTILCV
jgi:16S rRNA (guanine1207-N2)-methyltransferase